MQPVPLDERYFQGAVSIQRGDGWLKPWRLPWEQRALFPAPDDSLMMRAAMPSGVRLRFETNATRLKLTFDPLPGVPEGCERDAFHIDLTQDGELLVSAAVKPGEGEAVFEDLSGEVKTLEMWLLPEAPMQIRGLFAEEGSATRPAPDPRPRWVTYGSSLTHCVRAHSPARTWPAIVARRRNLHLTSLGFGGNCCLEPMVGRVIRDLPADYISLKLGINCISGALSPRTFPAAVVGLVQIIREKHPDTPIALVSPIGYPPNETTPNVLGYTISAMRRDIEDVYHRLRGLGDERLIYVNGLEVFDTDLIAQYTTDQCHPNGEGIEIMADHFDRAVMEKLLSL